MFNTKTKFSIFLPAGRQAIFNEFSIFRERGVSLYFGILMTSVLLAMVLGISVIMFSQIKMIKGMGDSVIALYAADTGVERVLFDNNLSSHYGPISLSNSSSYEVWVTQPLGGSMAGIPVTSTCSADYYCIKSIGIYQKTRRAIEVTR